ncbi:MAG TPA: hypothetical protein VJZ72_03255, partial [Candidatus Limnocylindrales bacterium]|nr:hypothetical protein [Candidatus Limnocylindrales bacterium]
DLHAGGSDGRRYRIGLPPESFASGPLDGLVLIGADDGSSSLLSILDLWAGCRHPVATETAVVRRATIGPDATAVYEFRVDRRSRADLGIWRRDLGVDGEPTQVLGALPTDDRFGLTWTTEFDWSDDGRLIVGSCGAAACRSRVFDPIDGSLISIEEPDLGETLGLLDGQLVSYLACRGLPCPVVAIDLIEGTRRVLAPAAGLATVVDDGGAGTLVHELVDRPGIIDIVSMTGASLRTIDLGGSRRLVASGARSGSAIDLPPGWLPVGPGGRISPVGRADGVRIRDGRITPAGEVIR